MDAHPELKTLSSNKIGSTGDIEGLVGEVGKATGDSSKPVAEKEVAVSTPEVTEPVKLKPSLSMKNSNKKVRSYYQIKTCLVSDQFCLKFCVFNYLYLRQTICDEQD